MLYTLKWHLKIRAFVKSLQETLFLNLENSCFFQEVLKKILGLDPFLTVLMFLVVFSCFTEDK